MTRENHSGCHRTPGAVARPETATTTALRPAPPAPPAPPASGYRGPVAAHAAGITYRQLDYWARSALVEPGAPARTGAGARLYRAGDVLLLAVVRRLLEAGVCLQQIRTTTATLREHLDAHPLPGPHEPGEHGAGAERAGLATLTLMCDGATVYPCTSADEVIELVQGGQGVFGIAVGPVWATVATALADLPAEDGPLHPAPTADELAERRAARATG